MSHPRDLLGQQVDHYLIETHLATGGMAEVYLAQDTWLDRLTVLKVLKSSLVDEADHRIRFQREAQAIAHLPHPHIVEIYNIGVLPDKRPYFTMPYLAGGSLAAWLQRQNGMPMAPQHALTLCRHIADALETAHQAGVVHRDLKPANILLRGPLDPVVTDFGIAALSQRSVQLTQPGMFLGTYLYASPEQKMGQPVDHRSDIYSLGIILFELLTGTLPYAQKRPFDQLQEKQPGFPTFVCELVDRCLQMQPADRYLSAAALRRDLDMALAGVTETRPTPIDKPALSSRWLKLMVPVVALLVIVAGYVVFVNRPAGVDETAVSILPAPTPVNVAAPTNQVVIVAVTSTLAPVITVDMPSTETPTPTPLPTKTETETAVPTATMLPAPLQARDSENVQAKRMVNRPIIDGYLDDWPQARKVLSPYLRYKVDQWDGTDDAVVYWQLGWDLDYLYISAIVIDDIHVQTQTGSQIFRGDSISLQLDVSLDDLEETFVSSDDFQIELSPGDFINLSPSAVLFRGTTNRQMRDAGDYTILLASQRTPDGYIVEAAVPWLDLEIQPAENLVFGAALNLNDNDTPDTAVQETFYSNVATRLFADPTSWGTLTLVP